MTFTVASSAISTNWAEFSTVSYSAGALADLGSCVEHVEGYLQRGSLSPSTTPSTSQVTNWLIRAKEELAETKQFTWRRRYVTATLTAGTYRYALPPDYGGGYISIRDMTDNKRIPLISNHTFDSQFPDMAEVQNGTILVATIKNMELQVAPAPDGNNVIEIDYERTGDDVTASDFSWLPEIERFRCCDFAIAESYLALHMWDAAKLYFEKWNYGLRKASKSDGRKRWSQMGYRIRSIFQG